MMKIYLLILLFLLFALTDFAQIKKLFVTAKGNLSENSKNATFYYLIEKKNDTAYLASKYDMLDRLVVKGAYKDADLKVANGVFEYYVSNLIKNLNIKYVTNEDRFIGTTGFFVNGMKTGTWVDYVQKDLKYRVYTYKDNKLNGPFCVYNENNNRPIEKGNFINDRKEGEVISFTNDGLKPYCTYIFLHDKIEKIIWHFKAPRPVKNFDKYLEKACDPFFDFLKENGIIVKVAINKVGTVDSLISISKALDQNVIDLLKTAFLNSPKFTPGISNDIPDNYIYTYFFRNGSAYDNDDDPYRSKREKIYLNHANDIGRGLNSVGIGKPVYE